MWEEFCEVYSPSSEKEKKIDKTTIDLDQAVGKKNNEEFTGEEVEQFLMEYIEWIESKGLITGGGCGFYEEEN